MFPNSYDTFFKDSSEKTAFSYGNIFSIEFKNISHKYMSINQLGHYISQLMNEQKMFPHTNDTFCCAPAYRMVFSMENV